MLLPYSDLSSLFQLLIISACAFCPNRICKKSQRQRFIFLLITKKKSSWSIMKTKILYTVCVLSTVNAYNSVGVGRLFSMFCCD